MSIEEALTYAENYWTRERAEVIARIAREVAREEIARLSPAPVGGEDDEDYNAEFDRNFATLLPRVRAGTTRILTDPPPPPSGTGWRGVPAPVCRRHHRGAQA